MKKMTTAAIWLFLTAWANAVELFYVSEDPKLLERGITLHNNGTEYKFSARPYGGFVVTKAIKVKAGGAFAVQLSGTLLEKDWPAVPLAARVGESWNLNIEKGDVGNGKAVLIVRDLKEGEADGILEQYSRKPAPAK